MDVNLKYRLSHPVFNYILTEVCEFCIMKNMNRIFTKSLNSRGHRILLTAISLVMDVPQLAFHLYWLQCLQFWRHARVVGMELSWLRHHQEISASFWNSVTQAGLCICVLLITMSYLFSWWNDFFPKHDTLIYSYFEIVYGRCFVAGLEEELQLSALLRSLGMSFSTQEADSLGSSQAEPLITPPGLEGPSVSSSPVTLSTTEPPPKSSSISTPR